MIDYINENQVLTLQECADELKISPTKTYELLNDGYLKGFKVGRIWRISRKAINEYIMNMSGFAYGN